MAIADFTENPTNIIDVVMYLKCCSDSFGQLDSIIKVIEDQSTEFSEVRKLAGAASYIASNFENLSDCWREEIQKKGVWGEPLTNTIQDRKAVIGSKS